MAPRQAQRSSYDAPVQAPVDIQKLQPAHPQPQQAVVAEVKRMLLDKNVVMMLMMFLVLYGFTKMISVSAAFVHNEVAVPEVSTGSTKIFARDVRVGKPTTSKVKSEDREIQELTVYTDVNSIHGQVEHRQKVHSEGPCQNVVRAKVNRSTKSCRSNMALTSSKFYQDAEEEAGHTRRKGARKSPAPPWA